jgi:hypothetical protein
LLYRLLLVEPAWESSTNVSVCLPFRVHDAERVVLRPKREQSCHVKPLVANESEKASCYCKVVFEQKALLGIYLQGLDLYVSDAKCLEEAEGVSDSRRL